MRGMRIARCTRILNGTIQSPPSITGWAQARNLIRSIKIHVTVREMPVSVVAYVRDPELQDTPTAGYRNVILMRSEEDNARAVIVEEMKRVSYATQRAKSLAAVFGLTTEIDHIATLAHSVAERAASAAPAASA